MPEYSGLLLSCTSTSFCLAGAFTGQAATWTGSAWHTAPGFAGGTGFTALSCVSASYCVAALDGPPATDGTVTTWTGTSWSAPVAADPDQRITSLSCPTVSFCAAGDFSGDMLEFAGADSGALRLLPAVGGRHRIRRVRPGQCAARRCPTALPTSTTRPSPRRARPSTQRRPHRWCSATTPRSPPCRKAFGA
jgi:hypothetical protein